MKIPLRVWIGYVGCYGEGEARRRLRQVCRSRRMVCDLLSRRVLSQLFFTLSIMLPVLPWKIESGIPGLSVLYLLQRVRTGQGFSCFVVENKKEIGLSCV